MEKMLRLFYEEASNEKIIPSEVPPFIDSDEKYGINTIECPLEYLEFIINEFHLNPLPRVILVVEGDGEEDQFPRIAEKVFGCSFAVFGIEIMNLKGVSEFTGKKKIDKYGALEKLIDYLHNKQIMVYIILDKEGGVDKIANKLIKTTSKRYPRRTIATKKHFCIWDRCIEFDNFNNEEIAMAMTKLCENEYIFSPEEIEESKAKYDRGEGDPLEDLFEKNTTHKFSKIILMKLLVDFIVANPKGELDEKGIAKRKLVKTIRSVIELAELNRPPSNKSIWHLNQISGYLGDKNK